MVTFPDGDVGPFCVRWKSFTSLGVKRLRKSLLDLRSGGFGGAFIGGFRVLLSSSKMASSICVSSYFSLVDGFS